ncbi:MAG: FHA domain-containing protein [Nanoarchaeota archaeon]
MKGKQLRDITYATFVKGYTKVYLLPADHKMKTIGRNPQTENGIKIDLPQVDDLQLQNYLLDIYSYISRVHAYVVHQTNGVLSIIAISKRSPTYIGTEKNPHETLVRKSEQLFPNHILTLGKYSMKLETVDAIAEANLEKKLQTSDTAQEDLSFKINESLLNLS